VEVKRADLILHPVRLRIILAFASDVGTRRLTAQQVAAALPDVPQASLYRHIERLYRGGVLAIAGERSVRGAIERTYVLAAGGAIVPAEELANATREEQLGYFTTFAVGLVAQFERYLQRPEIDLLADGVGYRQFVLNLSDEEFREMASALNAALARFIQLRPRPGRRRRTLGLVLLPQDEG
jgi:DNA-binding transcriptional ArsR family regulator